MTDDRVAEQPPCVVVLGMHRSGTSAIAGALRLFGLGLPRSDDLLVGAGNDRGHFESTTLTAFNDRLLGLLGGSWHRPPPLRAGWEHAHELEDSRHRAPVEFGAAFGNQERPVAFKDPRLSLLLPFWRTVLRRPVVAILAYRDPREVAASLTARDGHSRALGLALWDRYQRSALQAVGGLPLFVTHFEQVLGDPQRWADELASFLRAAGVEAHEPAPDTLSDWLDPALRRQRRSASGGGALLPALTALCERLRSLAGPHPRFETPALGEPDDWTSELLEARSDAAVTWNGLLWATDVLDRHASKPILARLVGPTLTRREGLTSAVPYPANATEDSDSYVEWRAARGLPARLPSRSDVLAGRGLPTPRTRPAEGPPRFSVVVPVFRPPLWALRRCVASVLEQTYASFELCLADDYSAAPDLTAALHTIGRLDPRIKVTALESRGGISAATNRAVSLASGEFIVFLDNDDELAPRALELLAEAADREPLADVLYSDEDKTDERGALFMPSFKPGWAPDMLLSCAYLCHVLVVRRSLIEQLGGLRPEFDGGQDYDLMLRATEGARMVVHVPEVLYHWRELPGSAAHDTTAKPWAYEAGHRALEDALERRGEDALVEDSTVIPGMYYVRRRVRGEPLVSVIVPFRDEPALLNRCVESVCKAPGHERLELVLVDNGSRLPETASLLDRLAEDPRVVLLEEPGPFNWSGINNAAAVEASGDLLLFLNNDVEATAQDWLLAMVEHAQREEVGAVGARLLYPNHTIQHAGVVLGMCNGAAHVLQDLPAESPGYLSWAYMTRDCAAVTGACLMTRRDVFESLGGFCEDLPIAFSDVDYCLRLRRGGRRIVYTPLAELVHREALTRGHADDAIELPRLLARWGDEIARGDPYFNPHLSLWRPWCPLSNPEEDEQWNSFRSKLERLQSR
jgi:O-antigen biosynthesis protein